MRRAILLSLYATPPAAVTVGWLLGWRWELAVLLPAPLLWLIATVVRPCSWWGPQMQRFDGRRREVLLTFDDGPCPQDTPKVLQRLAEAGAVAAFFVTGERARRYPELVQAIAQAGHALGCHTYTDKPWTWWLSSAQDQRIELEHCLGAIRDAVPAVHVRWCRTPGGLRNAALHPLLRHFGMELMAWSASDGEWLSQREEDSVLVALKRDIDKGAIVQLHQGRFDTQGRSRLLPVLDELLEWLRAQSYQIGV